MVAVSLKKAMLVWVCAEMGMIGFFQAEDGIRDVERSRGLGDVYKRQIHGRKVFVALVTVFNSLFHMATLSSQKFSRHFIACCIAHTRCSRFKG